MPKGKTMEWEERMNYEIRERREIKNRLSNP